MASFLDIVESLLSAAKNNELGKVSYILTKDRTLAIASDYDGVSALHVACTHGHLDMVKLLLEKGANVYSRTVDGATPLCEACAFGRTDIVELLLAHGAQLNPPCQLASPLHEAAASGRAEVCKLLVSHGAKVDVSDCWYGTPLHAACFRGHINAALALLNSGANVNARKIHSTPLHNAIEQHPENFELISMLISFGAKLSAKNNQGLKPADLIPKNDQKYANLKEYLANCEHSPRSLKMICKIRICSYYQSDAKIMALPLPVKLKEFLTGSKNK